MLARLLGWITGNPFGWPRCIAPKEIGKVGRAAVWAEIESCEISPCDCYVVIHTQSDDGRIKYYEGGKVVAITHDNGYSTIHFDDIMVRKAVWIHRILFCWRREIVMSISKHQTYYPGDMIHLDFALKASNL